MRETWTGEATAQRYWLGIPKAAWMLVLATVCWSVSFPLMRALQLEQAHRLPDCSSWFFSSCGVAYRFGLAGILLGLWNAWRGRWPTRREWEQGLVLGIWGSAGMVFQMDGLAYTTASISAFLTQGYVILLPLWTALRRRRWPEPRILLAACVVMLGVGILSRFDPRTFRMGRGELETLAAAVMFAGQILWLNHPRYRGTDYLGFSSVMFLVMALCGVVAGVWARAPWSAWCQAYAGVFPLLALGVLVGICTLGGYLLMNRWQPLVDPSRAGLIYCMEPVFAVSWALFLPGLLSRWVGISYSNEQVTFRLVVGGLLILSANAWIEAGGKPQEKEVSQPAQSATS